MHGIALGLVKVFLQPRPGCIFKVLPTSFRSQVVILYALCPPPFAVSAEERRHLLCPVRALMTCRLLWPLAQAVPVPSVFRCWPQRACQLQAPDFLLGDGLISLAYKILSLPSPLGLKVKSSQVTFIYIALLTIQIVTKHCTISK